MDIITLLVSFLAPYLPALLGLGNKALGKGAEKLGEKGAEEIFKKLSPHMWQWRWTIWRFCIGIPMKLP